jgi:hypothetical protein
MLNGVPLRANGGGGAGSGGASNPGTGTGTSTPAPITAGYTPPVPSWTPQAISNLVGASNAKKGSPMKSKGIIILLALLGAAIAFGQTDNTIYVKSFVGSNVGAKVAAAQSTCSPNTAIPCILILDPSLAAYPAGTMPTLNANVTLYDYRTGNVTVSNANSAAGPIPGATLSIGQNLVPDSAFTAGQNNSLAYWSTLYGTGISSGWSAASNTLSFTGTGSAIPGNTLAESRLFILPFSATSYTVTIALNANLTNQTGGVNTVNVSLYTSTGPPTITTQYCAINFITGSNGTHLTTCSIPGNAGTLSMVINMGGGTTVVASGQTVTFSQPQVNIGSLQTYSATVGANQFVIQPPASATSPNTGLSFYQFMLAFIPQTLVGTLSSGQTPVTLTTTPQEVLASVSSSLAFRFGCAGATCETMPGIPTTSAALYNGIVRVECTAVTTAGTATVSLATSAAANSNVWTAFSGDGLDSYSLPIAVNAGTIDYFFPFQAGIGGLPVNHDIGAFDFMANVSAAVAPAGACVVNRASLIVSIVPTDSTTAGQPAILSYADRSHLVY